MNKHPELLHQTHFSALCCWLRPSHNLNLQQPTPPPIAQVPVLPPSHRSLHLPAAAGLAVLQVQLRVLAAALDPCRAGTDLASPCLEPGRGEQGEGGGEVGVFGCSAGLSQSYESDRTGTFNPSHFHC